jgi:hypothetical protein
VALGGIVLVAADESNATLYAVRESDGALLWTWAAYEQASPTVTSDAVFMPHNCGVAYRIDRDAGATVWANNSATCSNPYAWGSIAILDGQLYVPGGVVDDPASGAQTGTFDSMVTAAGSGGVGYFIPYATKTLTAIPLGSSTPKWSASDPVYTPPIVVGSNVVAASYKGLYVYSTIDGSLVSSDAVSVSSDFYSAGIQEADGLLFVVTSDGLVVY